MRMSEQINNLLDLIYKDFGYTIIVKEIVVDINNYSKIRGEWDFSIMSTNHSPSFGVTTLGFHHLYYGQLNIAVRSNVCKNFLDIVISFDDGSTQFYSDYKSLLELEYAISEAEC